MRCDAVQHNTMNVMRGRPYRSKMACTPAMAFRLFSSLEGVGFSAGPGAGMTEAAAASGRSREKQTSRSKQSSLLVQFTIPLRRIIWLSLSQSPSPEALWFVVNVRVLHPPDGNAEVPRSRIRPGEVLLILDGPGDVKGREGRRARSSGSRGYYLPTPELKPVPPSRRRTTAG